MAGAWPRSPSYLAGSILNWIFFVAAVFVATANPRFGWLPEWAVWVLLAAVVVSVAFQFLAAYRLIARQDEFVRGITAKRCLVAIGLTITAAVGWGLFEQFGAAPRLPLWLVYPFFWGALGLVTPFIRTSQA